MDDFTTLNTFAENSVTGINRMSDGKHYTALSENRIIKYNIITGQPVQTLLDGVWLVYVHGTGDDNVHFQNSIVLEDALINAASSLNHFTILINTTAFRALRRSIIFTR